MCYSVTSSFFYNLYTSILLDKILMILFSVEGIRGDRPQAPLGERAQAASLQNEDLLP